MLTIAYLTNEFPSPMEWYVMEEIRELRRRGVEVIPCSARTVKEGVVDADLKEFCRQTISLQPLSPAILAAAMWHCLSRLPRILDLLHRILLSGKESPTRRARTLLHTLLGAYCAELLRGRGVQHIHVHHGYFSSWIALVAARLLGATFSLTLHGSDLLLHPAYLDAKLKQCRFCLTVSEFNRDYILASYPEVDSTKIFVQRIGVPVPNDTASPSTKSAFTLLAVGRLHPVKNYRFLLQACRLLRQRDVRFRCLIVGDGPERNALANAIAEWKLEDVVQLLGHVPHRDLAPYYRRADLVVLTSHSEGIPIVLMEAMAQARLVLAPRITGIPELVIDGKTGFLYSPGHLEEFVETVREISLSLSALAPIQQAARDHVRLNFNQPVNLTRFADLFLQQLRPCERSCRHENPLLQQI